jgi:hypothetical protein
MHVRKAPHFAKINLSVSYKSMYHLKNSFSSNCKQEGKTGFGQSDADQPNFTLRRPLRYSDYLTSGI